MNIIEKAMRAEAERRRKAAEPAPADPGPATPAAPETVVARGPSPARRPVAVVATSQPGSPAVAAPAGTADTEPGSVPVPFSSLGRTGFLGPDTNEPGLLAELRHLKRSILHGAFGALAESGANVVMLTSALPNAGKTFLSASLAQAMVLERDRTTLLIDADDARSTLSRALGRHGQPGLFDLLHDPALVPAAAVQATDMPGLSFLPSGGQFQDSLELLTSRRAREIFAALADADRNRLIIVDCPPLLATPNGAALVALAGQTLLVVEAGATDAVTLNKAVEMLNRDRPVGMVLNKAPRSRLLANGGSGYYYAPTRD